MINNSENRRVLLISNSTLYGSGYLDHTENEIRDFLANVGRVLFVPFALYDRDAYAATARDRYRAMGYALTSVHAVVDVQKAVNDTDAIFIGGGNTFRLLKALYDFDLLTPIRRRVDEGMPYVGSSAGANVAGPRSRQPRTCRLCNHPHSTLSGWSHLSCSGSGRLFYRLNRQTCFLPGAPASCQGSCLFPSSLSQFLRHTGARGFIRSSTISHEPLVWF